MHDMGVVMKDSYNLIDFIKMYYLDSNIPMYLFEGGNCIFCMPKQTDLTIPRRNIQRRFWIQEKEFHTAPRNMAFFSVH